jgi:hypothetical protein
MPRQGKLVCEDSCVEVEWYLDEINSLSGTSASVPPCLPSKQLLPLNCSSGRLSQLSYCTGRSPLPQIARNAEAPLIPNWCRFLSIFLALTPYHSQQSTSPTPTCACQQPPLLQLERNLSSPTVPLGLGFNESTSA